MSHPAFESAGDGPGIEVWTIETTAKPPTANKFEPVPVDSKVYGKFYNGDSYIVLKTRGKNNSSLAYDAHFWLGSKATQDKTGSAAIWTVTLDDKLGGRAVHHREVQGHESSQFLGYFKPAIRYLEGGNESGFTEVKTNAGAEKRLLKLSGCDNMRIEEVEAEASSLTKEHCFILELDHDIFVLIPEGARATLRRKIISVANTLRDDYHNGRATIEILDEFSSDEDIQLFFDALGSGSKDDLGDGSEDETFVRADQTAVYLNRVLVGDETEFVSLSKPYKQSHLNSDEIYILDTPDSGLFVWLGKEVDPELVKNYYTSVVQRYLDDKEYPSWIHITRVSEEAECSNFKQYFHNWDSVDAGGFMTFAAEGDAGYYSEDAEEAAAAAKLIGKSAAARGYMPDQGDGILTVTRIAGDQEDVTEKMQSEVAVFFNSDVYVVKYQFEVDGEDSFVVYMWIGENSSNEDKMAALALVADIEDEVEGKLAIVTVPQGKEPKHLLSIFKGNLAVLIGSKDYDYKPQNYKGTYDEDSVRLFKVSGTELGGDMRVMQIKESAELLEDDDVFVLTTPAGIIVRNGKDSDPKEQEAALNFVKLVAADQDISVVAQGDEPEEFWEALGGIPEEKETPSWKQKVSRRVNTPASLTAVNVTVTGKIKFEELSDFNQQDLSEDGAYILDAGEELYLWQGKNIPERVKNSRAAIVMEYIKDDGLERTVDSALVLSIRQGGEPGVFRKLFPEWDSDMWENLTSYEDLKNEAQSSN